MLLKHLVNKIKAATRDLQTGGKRSPQWPKVEREFRLHNPTCAACGSAKKLNVHHQRPFHLNPELELDMANLITLCMDNDCHIKVGHGDNFKAYNPDVVLDSALVFSGRPDFQPVLKEVEAKVKAKRLFE